MRLFFFMLLPALCGISKLLVADEILSISPPYENHCENQSQVGNRYRDRTMEMFSDYKFNLTTDLQMAELQRIGEGNADHDVNVDVTALPLLPSSSQTALMIADAPSFDSSSDSLQIATSNADSFVASPHNAPQPDRVESEATQTTTTLPRKTKVDLAAGTTAETNQQRR